MDKKMKKAMSVADMMQEAMHEPVDVREKLRPHIGQEVRVSGLVDKLSMTKGKYPKPSALLVDVKIFIEDEEIELDYIWLVSDKFKAGQKYVFSANVIEYTTYDMSRNAMTKYGFGSIRRIVKHNGDLDAAMRVADGKAGLATKAKEGGDANGVSVIEEVLALYGLVITPTVVAGGKWQCSIHRVGVNENITISTEDTFAAATIKARDIVAFLCEPL